MDLQDIVRRRRALTERAVLFRDAAVLLTANQIGVFEALAEGPLKTDALVSALGTSERGLSILLDAAVALDLLTKDGGAYALTRDSLEFLVPGGPFYTGDILRHQNKLFERFSRLENSVRSGEGVPRTGPRRTPGEQRDFILGMANGAAISARLLLPHLGLRGDERMLDVGGGPGTYLQVFLEAHPAMAGTNADLPETIAIAREYLAGKPGADRIELLEADFLKGGFGKDFDAALASNVIHMLDPHGIATLFANVRASMVEGGRLFVKDFFLEPDRTAPAGAALFALTMLLSTRGGASYTFDETEAWMREAGFEPVRRFELTGQSSVIEGEAV